MGNSHNVYFQLTENIVTRCNLTLSEKSEIVAGCIFNFRGIVARCIFNFILKVRWCNFSFRGTVAICIFNFRVIVAMHNFNLWEKSQVVIPTWRLKIHLTCGSNHCPLKSLMAGYCVYLHPHRILQFEITTLILNSVKF